MGHLDSVEWNSGLECWNGMLKWNAEMERWNGMLEWTDKLDFLISSHLILITTFEQRPPVNKDHLRIKTTQI